MLRRLDLARGHRHSWLRANFTEYSKKVIHLKVQVVITLERTRRKWIWSQVRRSKRTGRYITATITMAIFSTIRQVRTSSSLRCCCLLVCCCPVCCFNIDKLARHGVFQLRVAWKMAINTRRENNSPPIICVMNVIKGWWISLVGGTFWQKKRM